MFLSNLRIFLFLEVSALLLSCIFAVSDNECNRHKTCRDCIRQHQCQWCSQTNFVNEERCFSKSAGRDVTSSCDSVTDPQVSVTITEGELGASYDGRHLSDFAEGEVPRLIQITPLEVNLKLRPNEKLTIPVTFKLSKDYPLDLYYLTDKSHTMRNSIEQVANEGEKISKVMRNITKNFRLGCGIFVEKPVRPFNYYYRGCEQQEQVCRVQNEEGTWIDKPEFQNLMPLEANSSQFRKIMMDIKSSLDGNQDDPESGLSALMQVMVCKDAIGWRDNSNRLVVYSTDSEYHQAGDGKLGGIVIPNDGLCHLDHNGFYTHAAVLDYPSVSHINYIAAKHNTKIIFAITDAKAYDDYIELSRAIKGSSFAALEADSSSVVDLIEAEYRKIISNVELQDNSSSYVDVKYRASCAPGAPFRDLQRCESLKIGDEVKFEVTFMLKECPSDVNSRFETFEIKPSKMNESVVVNVDMICECPCEKEGVIPNAAQCNGAGTYQCGICTCNDGYSGWNCQCHNWMPAADNSTSASRSCVPPGADVTAPDCNGVGECECGRCVCHEPQFVTGTYCDCNNNSCRKRDNLMCNGHGRCECGTCVCDMDWSHASPQDDPVCDCHQSQEACLGARGVLCGGHGWCKCNRCECQDGFGGERCEEPPLNLQFCKELEPCVECLAYGTGPKLDLQRTTTNCSEECAFELSFFAADSSREEKGMKCFSSKDHNGCSYRFIYRYEDMRLRVWAQKEKPACEKIDYLKYILTTTAIGLFAGVLALIAWKLATMTFDRLEYMKFMKEQGKANWDSAGNPLYRAPTTTIQNPMFQPDS